MDTRLLRAYLTVLELGSVTAAARGLGYTQPAVSQQLAALEHLLGGRLFERGQYPLTPTAFGDRIYPHARATMLIVGDLLDIARQDRR